MHGDIKGNTYTFKFTIDEEVAKELHVSGKSKVMLADALKRTFANDINTYIDIMDYKYRNV